MTRSAFINVCYATFSLERSLHKSLDLDHRAAVNVEHRDARPAHHRDVQAKKPRDVEDEQHRDVHRDIQEEKPRGEEDELHRDVPSERHRVFINSVHREVRTQLTRFLAASVDDLSVTCQPYVVEYYSELTTLCLSHGLMSDEDFIPLLSLCLSSSLYDVRLSALQFIAGVLAGTSGALKDDDDDDDDGDVRIFPLDFPGNSNTANLRELLLSKLMTPVAGDCRDLHQVIVNMLLHSESHDECLLMVSC